MSSVSHAFCQPRSLAAMFFWQPRPLLAMLSVSHVLCQPCPLSAMFSADVECDTDSYTNMWPGPFGNLANSGEAERTRVDPRQGLSSTAPGRLQAMEDTQEVDSSTLFKVSRTWLRSLVTVLVNLSCMDILSLSLSFFLLDFHIFCFLL